MLNSNSDSNPTKDLVYIPTTLPIPTPQIHNRGQIYYFPKCKTITPLYTYIICTTFHVEKSIVNLSRRVALYLACGHHDVVGQLFLFFVPILCPPTYTLFDLFLCVSSFSPNISFSRGILLARMEFLLGHMNEDSSHFQQDVTRCPFLRNINEPTNLSFATSMSFSLPVQEAKGPIFEDGPNFDLAFRLFHGQNGVVPLSGRSLSCAEKSESEPARPQFNPLAAKAATISLSGFGSGGPFGFDAFNEMWKKKNEKSKSSKEGSSSKGGNSKHEALSNEWLQNGNCPIAKSYRAVSKVLPLVAKAIQLPSGVKYKCPPAIVAARAALSKTAFAKNLRPQPLPAKILAIGAIGMAANIPLGIWREHTEKFSPSWFAAVHAAVPFIAMLRKSVLMPKAAMAFTIAASILGQVIGSRAERYRLKAVSTRKLEVIEASRNACSQVAVTGVKGHAGEIVNWNKVALQVGGVSSSPDVI